MMILGWMNLLALLGLAWRQTRDWPVPRMEKPLWGAGLIWFALIMTGHTLSPFGQLGNPWLYAALSPLWLCAGFALLRLLAPFSSQTVSPCPDCGLRFQPWPERTARWLQPILLALLGLAALCSLLLVLNNLPGNADSVSYRLPRAFWYVSHGSLLHPFDNIDRRILFYPLNGTLLYTPLVAYGFSGVFHNLPTYLAWLLVCLACYRFVREMGGDRLHALLTTALAMLTPNILVQAAATNDEILAGGALLLAVYGLWRWARSGQNIYLLFSALLAGISIGTKLHIVFYLPVLFLGFSLAGAAAWRHPSQAAILLRRIGWRVPIACLLLGMLMALPFLFYNYASTGRFYFTDDFAGDFFNTHGKLQVIKQNLLIYAAQLLFAPIADLYGTSDYMLREAFHRDFNQFFAPWIAPHLSDNPADYHLQYRFKGITLPVSPYYLEYSLWAGFGFLLAPLVWGQAWRKRRMALGYALLLLAAAPLLWFLTWCAATLYMEGTPTYLAYYLVISSPTLALALLRMDKAWLDRLRWGAVAFVLLTHVVIAVNTYRFNEFRNIPRLFTSTRLPYDWELMDESVINEIKAARNIHITFTRWGMSYFGIMQHHPQAFYYGPQENVTDKAGTLTLFSVPSEQYWGFVPVHVPRKPNPGATFIGKMRGWGPEGVFAVGNNVAKRWPDRNRYVIFQIKSAATADGTQITVTSYTPGYRDSDPLEIQYALHRDMRRAALRDWNRDPFWQVTIPVTAQTGSNDEQVLQINIRLPGQSEADATASLNLRDMTEWTDRMIGATPWIEKNP